jgi:two-component sensor histidine kinase
VFAFFRTPTRPAGKLAEYVRAGLLGGACAVGAIALRGLLDFIAPDMEPYPLVFPAVLIAALASGWRGGAVALAVGLAASDFFFVQPRDTFLPGNLTHALSLAVTTLALTVVLWLACRYRRTMLLRAREREESEEHLRLLLREVDHRANNLLAVVQSIVSLTKVDSLEALNLKHDLLGRIQALARAHQLLAGGRWRGAQIGQLVEEELRPYQLGDVERAHAEGPSMELSPAEAESVAMAIHELATNAAKYGALSAQGGRVAVTWERGSGGERRIRWQEDGGPPVVEPERRGLGMKLLERAFAGSDGHTRLLWRPEGIVCEFELPPEKPEHPDLRSIDQGLDVIVHPGNREAGSEPSCSTRAARS